MPSKRRKSPTKRLNESVAPPPTPPPLPEWHLELREMFRGELDADVVDMIVEQFDGDQQAALETLLQMSAVSVEEASGRGGGGGGEAGDGLAPWSREEEKNCFKGIITTEAEETLDLDNDSPPSLRIDEDVDDAALTTTPATNNGENEIDVDKAVSTSTSKAETAAPSFSSSTSSVSSSSSSFVSAVSSTPSPPSPSSNAFNKITPSSLSVEAPVFVPRFLQSPMPPTDDAHSSRTSTPAQRPPPASVQVPRRPPGISDGTPSRSSTTRLPHLPPPSTTYLPHTSLTTSTPEMPPSTSEYSTLVAGLGVALEKMDDDKRALFEFENIVELSTKAEGDQIWREKPKPRRGSTAAAAAAANEAGGDGVGSADADEVGGGSGSALDGEIGDDRAKRTPYTSPFSDGTYVGVELSLTAEQVTPIAPFDAPLPQRSRIRKPRSASPGREHPRQQTEQRDERREKQREEQQLELRRKKQKEELQHRVGREKEQLQLELDRQKELNLRELEDRERQSQEKSQLEKSNPREDHTQTTGDGPKAKNEKRATTPKAPSVKSGDENANFFDSAPCNFAREWPAAQNWPVPGANGHIRNGLPSGSTPKRGVGPPKTPSFSSMAKDLSKKGISPGPQTANASSAAKGFNRIDRLWERKKSIVERLVNAEKKKVLILMRGCSGSGKSTLANVLKLDDDKGVACSTDDYFTGNNGEYRFERSELQKAHVWNFERVEWFVKKGKHNPVIVDNTNTEKWEMVPYARLATKYGYHLEIMEPETPWAFKASTLFKKSKHGVQLDTIRHSVGRYEKNVTVADLLAIVEKEDEKEAANNNAVATATPAVDTNHARKMSASPSTLSPRSPFVKKTKASDTRDAPKDAKVISNAAEEKKTEDEAIRADGGTTVRREETSPRVEALVAKVAELDLSGENGASERDVSTNTERNVTETIESLVDYDSSDYESAEEDDDSERDVDEDLSKPSDDHRSTVSSITDQSAAASSITDQSAAASSITDQLAAASCITDQSAAVSSITDQSAAASSITDQSAAVLCITDQLAAVSCITDQSAAVSSITVQSPHALLLERNLNGFEGHFRDEGDSFGDMEEEIVADASVDGGFTQSVTSASWLSLPYESDSEDEEVLQHQSKAVCHGYSKPRLDEDLKTTLMTENRWDFPAFPGGDDEKRRKNSLPPPLVTVKRPTIDSGTFTESADFLFVRQTLEITNLGPRNRVRLDDYLLVGARARTITTDDMKTECSLSKSCSVDNEIGEDALSLGAVVFLKECFPNCRANLLENILEKCGGDTELAVEVIVNLGYDVETVDEPFVDLEAPRMYHHLQDSAEPDEILQVDIGGDANDIHVKRSPRKKTENEMVDVRRTGVADTLRRLTIQDVPEKGERNDREEMVLNMDTPLLNGLQEKFGVLPLNTEQSVQYLQGCGLSLQLDERSAAAFFQFLKTALSPADARPDLTDEEKREASDPSCENDAAIARLLQNETGGGDGRLFRPSPSAEGEFNDLRQIMEEERIITNKRKERDVLKRTAVAAAEAKKPMVRHSISSQLKFKKLLEMFCEVDEEMLEQTFALHNFGFEQTVNSLKAAGVRLKGEAAAAAKEDLSTIDASSLESSSSATTEDHFEEAETDDLDYEELRSDAFMHHQKRAQLFQKAQRAFESNMKPAAFYYSQLAHKEGEKVRAANSRASEILFDSRHAAVEKNNKLDLHSLHVDEAVKLVKEILGRRMSELSQIPAASRLGKNKAQITVVTGRGNHSRGGNAKVRPSVINYLKQNNFYFTESNPGVLEVFLKQTLSAN